MTDHGDGRAGVKPKHFQRDRTFSGCGGIAFALSHHPSPPRTMQTRCSDHSVLLAMVYLGGSATLTGCVGPQSTLDPAGPAAASIATLWWTMLAGAAVLFVLVMTLFALAVTRPQWGATSPARWIVLGGVCLPGVVLTPLVAYALITGERLLARQTAEPLRIEAEGRQWSWTFRYPGYGGIKTEGVLHLPAGVPVDVVVTSLDVIHAFWIPRLAGMIDAVPGHQNLLRVEADVAGSYQGICNQFCGLGHSEMRFDVIVHPAADFAAAIARAGKAAQ
jgi:cytochrome c oxidase subunit 2